MEFETKRALLEYLGKNGKDNKLVDRMVMRGEVRIEDGMYYLEVGDDGMLRRENEELKKRISEMENCSVSSETNPSELEEARIQWKYYEDLANRRGKMIELVIHETYVVAKSKLGNKMEDEAEFRSTIIGKVKEKMGGE